MKKLSLYGAWFAIILGIFLRFYQFGSLPLSLNRDEVALGYNAYAIAHSGIDEWGISYPLMFKSFGDYKLPGYIYSLALMIKLFGVSEVVIRFPSLMAGVLVIFATYRMAQILKLKKSSALYASAVVALSPWAIFYSRIAFEANVGLALFLAALIGMVSKKTTYQVLGIIFYIGAIITYNTPLMLVPLLLIWIMAGQKKLPARKKALLISSVLLIVGIWTIALQPLISQKSNITIFSDPSIKDAQAKAHFTANSPAQKIWNQKYVYMGRIVFENVVRTISPRFLTMSGGENPWHGVPDTGHLYWISYLSAIGCLFIYKGKVRQKKLALPLLMVGFGILPAIITIDAPHATRSLIAFIGIAILSALTFEKIPKARIWLTTILLVEALFFAGKYFVDYPGRHSHTWQVGLKEKIDTAANMYQEEVVNITIPQNQPYIYALLYQRVDPQVYVSTVEYYGPDSAGIEYVKSFAGWSFIGDMRDTIDHTPIIHQKKNGQYILLPDKNAPFK